MILYKFSTPDCRACKNLKLVLDKLNEAVYNGTIEVVEVDATTASQEMLKKFMVTSVPVLGYDYEDGSVNVLLGFRGEAKTREFIDNLIGELP